MRGYVRRDGRVGIRNHVAVIYTVECAHHVAANVAARVPGTQVMGFAGCYADAYASATLRELAVHPNVAGAVLISLGCESTNVDALAGAIAARGKPVEVLRIQDVGGTRKTIARGAEIAGAMVGRALSEEEPVPITWSDVIVGVECGGSDATSGLSANPAVGAAVDLMVDQGATVIFSEVPELLGADEMLLSRAVDHSCRTLMRDALGRARRLGQALGMFAISTGNHAGGLTTIEEKSLGALAKSGTRPIQGVIKTGERPCHPGLYLLDKVGDVEGRQLTHYEENDNDGLVSLLASGAQLLLFTTGRGSVVGSVLAPVIKVCGNPLTHERMGDNMDVNAGTIITGTRTIADVGADIVCLAESVVDGALTCAEELGHTEYWIPYKPGRACDLMS